MNTNARLSAEERAIRDENRFGSMVLRNYILHIKKERNGSLNCERCGAPGIDLNHKRYGVYVTIDDLELICEQCHYKQPPVKVDNHPPCKTATL